MKVSEPVAMITCSNYGANRCSAVLMVSLEDGFADLGTFARQRPSMADPTRVRFVPDLSTSLADFHNTGVYTEDTDKNTMVARSGGSFVFPDLDFDNLFPWRLPNSRRAVNCLSKYFDMLHASSPNERARFVDGDLQRRGTPVWRERLGRDLGLC